MPSIKLPSNVGFITLSGNTLNPTNGVITTTDSAAFTALTHHTTKPSFVRSAANGDITLKLPAVLGSINMAGNNYYPNGSGEITVPAAAATAYLQELKYNI